MLGLLSSLFCSHRDEWNERPKVTSASIEIPIPDNVTLEEIIKIQQRAQEHIQMFGMRKSEQLDYLKRKNGL